MDIPLSQSLWCVISNVIVFEYWGIEFAERAFLFHDRFSSKGGFGAELCDNGRDYERAAHSLDAPSGLNDVWVGVLLKMAH